jgi:hypothetical protein
MTEEVIVENNDYYLLRVNLSGFKLSDIRVNILKENLINKIEIKAVHIQNDENGSPKSTNEYTKVFELSKKTCSNINLDSMETSFAEDDKHLIIKFKSNKNENHLINLLNNSNEDDIYVNLIEKTVKNLQNFKNLDDIKDAIESVLNESNFNFNHEKKTDKKNEETLLVRHALDDDLHLLSKHQSSPVMHIITNDDGSKQIRINLKIPQTINAVIKLTQKSEIEQKANNHLYLTTDKLTVNLDAEAKLNNDTASKFTKQFNLPIGTDYEKLKYHIDSVTNSLIIEAPYLE